MFPIFCDEYMHPHIYLQIKYYTLKKFSNLFPFLVNFSLIRILWLGMAKHIYNSSTNLVKAGLLQVGRQPGLHSDTLLEKRERK